jgi:hypothetical protein
MLRRVALARIDVSAGEDIAGISCRASVTAQDNPAADSAPKVLAAISFLLFVK